jgi:hypothetical protein
MDGKHLNNEEKLEAIYKMTLENHDMLKSLRRQQYFSTFARIFYWLVVLGALGGAYYYVRPVIALLSENSGKIQEGFNQLETLKNQLPETRILNQVIQGLQKSAVGGTATISDGPVEGFEVVPATTTP